METTRKIGTLDATLITEAAMVGIIVVIMGVIVYMIMCKLKPELVPKECADWNKNHCMEMCLFATGALTHIVCEFSGINQKYVDKY